MAQVEIETVTYPSWWPDATTLYIQAGGTGYNIPRDGVELLPEGVSFRRPSDDAFVLFPWHAVDAIVTE